MKLYEVTKTTNRDAIDAQFDYLNGYIQAYFEMRGENETKSK